MNVITFTVVCSMPKFTITGKELGASECGAIVLGKTAFTTRDKILQNTKDAIKGLKLTKVTLIQLEQSMATVMRLLQAHGLVIY